MKTLYVDVYFLINFTVDVLALYFAAMLCKIKAGNKRFIISGALGAMSAVINALFFNNIFIVASTSILSLAVMVWIISGNIGIYRKIKYIIAFLMFQLLIGGCVYYAYCLLDEAFKRYKFPEGGGENKKLIILSVVILLSIGLLKLLIALFGNFRSEKVVSVSVEYNGRCENFDAMVDSGNLALDPFDKTPVMIVNESLAKKLFSFDVSNVSKFGANHEISKRIRIIPVSFGGEKRLLFGIRPDSITVINASKKEKISLIIAVDTNIKNYGGYPALMPLSALEDVFYDI